MVKDEPIQMSKKKKRAGGVHGYQGTHLKLDLKNSTWWRPGFDNDYLEEQLKNFLNKPQEEIIEKVGPMMLEVREAM